MILPIQNLRAADLLRVCCHIQKERCPSFNAGCCANILPMQELCKKLLQAPRASPGCLYGRGVISLASSGRMGRKKEDLAHFQPVTCYFWLLPNVIPSWQSLKPKQLLRHPFDLTNQETSEGAVPWSPVIKSVRGTQAETLRILVLPAAVPSPAVRTSICRL